MEGVIGHHGALGQLFFDILVDTMTQSQPAVTENRDPVFLEGEGLHGRGSAICGRVLAGVGDGELFLKLRA